MRTLLLIIIVGIIFSGCVSTPTDSGGNSGGISSQMLVRGAACEVNEDCVYALNAHTFLRCVSENCPPAENEQPVQGDPAYEWVQAYGDACVNGAALENKNFEGEPLQIDTRAATCACEPIAAGPNGEHTSLTGQKVCVKKVVE